MSSSSSAKFVSKTNTAHWREGEGVQSFPLEHVHPPRLQRGAVRFSGNYSEKGHGRGAPLDHTHAKHLHVQHMWEISSFLSTKPLPPPPLSPPRTRAPYPSKATFPFVPSFAFSVWTGVYGANRCQPVRGANSGEECHWSHACSLQAEQRRESQWHSSSANFCRKLAQYQPQPDHANPNTAESMVKRAPYWVQGKWS
jgi:hypothetical protein